jgi:hypothetical protein
MLASLEKKSNSSGLDVEIILVLTVFLMVIKKSSLVDFMLDSILVSMLASLENKRNRIQVDLMDMK